MGRRDNAVEVDVFAGVVEVIEQVRGKSKRSVRADDRLGRFEPLDSGMAALDGLPRYLWLHIQEQIHSLGQRLRRSSHHQMREPINLHIDGDDFSMDFVYGVDERFDIQTQPEDWIGVKTVQDVVDLVNDYLKGRRGD